MSIAINLDYTLENAVVDSDVLQSHLYIHVGGTGSLAGGWGIIVKDTTGATFADTTSPGNEIPLGGPVVIPNPLGTMTQQGSTHNYLTVESDMPVGVVPFSGTYNPLDKATYVQENLSVKSLSGEAVWAGDNNEAVEGGAIIELPYTPTDHIGEIWIYPPLTLINPVIHGVRRVIKKRTCIIGGQTYEWIISDSYTPVSWPICV